MMNNTKDSETEINQIRIQLFNESRNLSVSEQSKKTNQIANDVIKKLGLELAKKNIA
jgi:hypothetical protein